MSVNRQQWVDLYRRLGLRQALADYGVCLQDVVSRLPHREKRRLSLALVNAGTSLARSVGDAATSESDEEKVYSLDKALESLSETTACLQRIEQGGYLKPLPHDPGVEMKPVYDCGERLASALKTLRRALPDSTSQIETNGPATED